MEVIGKDEAKNIMK